MNPHVGDLTLFDRAARKNTHRPTERKEQQKIARSFHWYRATDWHLDTWRKCRENRMEGMRERGKSKGTLKESS